MNTRTYENIDRHGSILVHMSGSSSCSRVSAEHPDGFKRTQSSVLQSHTCIDGLSASYTVHFRDSIMQSRSVPNVLPIEDEARLGQAEMVIERSSWHGQIQYGTH